MQGRHIPELTGPSRGLSRRSIAIIGEAGASTKPLPDTGTVAIGRAPECEICIADPRLSRRHVLLQLTPGTVEIVDLGSRNGTQLGNRRLAPNEPTPLPEGVSVTVGSTVFMLQHTNETARPRRLLTHGYFEARVDEECARASRGGAPFAVLRVRSVDVRRSDSVAELLGSWTRALDVIGIYAPGRYEVLLAQTDEPSAEHVAHEISAGFRQHNVDVEVDLACFPRDGRTAEALVDRAPWRNDATFADERPNGQAPLAVGFMARIEPMLRRIASGEISVLILGETGVGKEVMSRRIHQLSRRASQAFVALNCSALSESLLESELFGHEKGAFTGALQAKPGLLESADGGTIFLDEIGEMSMAIQAKLLRVLEQREITRVGALKARPIDVRFLAATNRDLEREAQLGKFRQDLYFRLNGITLSIPPLRERIDEIEALAYAFIEEAGRRAGKMAHIGIDRDAMALLRNYPWPGNIRELRNMIERAVLLCSGGMITPTHLPTEKMRAVVPPQVPRYSSTPGTEPPPPSASAPGPGSAPPSSRRFDLPAISPLPPPPRSPTPSETFEALEVKVPPGDEERRRIISALERCGGNQTAAARLLGISRRTLVSRLSAYDLPRPRKR